MKSSTCTPDAPAGHILITFEPGDFRKSGSRLVKATTITRLEKSLARMRKSAHILGLGFDVELNEGWSSLSCEEWPSGESHYILHNGEMKRPLAGREPTVRVLIGGMDR